MGTFGAVWAVHDTARVDTSVNQALRWAIVVLFSIAIITATVIARVVGRSPWQEFRFEYLVGFLAAGWHTGPPGPPPS